MASGQDAYEKIIAGASLVQMYTMLAYEGPGAVRRYVNPLMTSVTISSHRAKKELAALLRSKGHRSVQDAVGSKIKSKDAAMTKEE